jgi:LacI family transcriptional regulator
MFQRVTLRDIAKDAGVHFTTVGLALRNDPRVTPATAARVQASARKLGYAHDAMLSALSLYRHRNSQRFAGVIAYVVTYSPEQLKANLTEQVVVAATTAHALAHNFRLESFQIDAPEMTAERLSKLLRARGIQGMILAPRLPTPGPIPNIEWEHFSPVAMGFSITNLTVHRVCPYHTHNVRVCLRQMRAHGYRRIGLILPREIYERNRGHVLGAYAAEQYLLPETERVTPLFVPNAQITKATVGQWLRDQQLDGVILSSMPLEIMGFIRELGYRVPDQLGVALICLYGQTEHFAGIDEHVDQLGEGAVDAVIAMIGRNEKGLPAHPHYTLIEGSWVERPTVRAVTPGPAV